MNVSRAEARERGSFDSLCSLRTNGPVPRFRGGRLPGASAADLASGDEIAGAREGGGNQQQRHEAAASAVGAGTPPAPSAYGVKSRAVWTSETSGRT